MARKRKKATKRTGAATARHRYVPQTDVPGVSLEQALRIPRALADNYGGHPATPLQVAAALNVAPTSGPFRQLCGASIAYGLTEGGYKAREISLQPLAKRILGPLEEGDDKAAKREAILKPRVVGQFLKKYSGSPLPRRDIAMNVLQEMKVPANRTESVYKLILDSAQAVGLLREIKSKQYVDLSGVKLPAEEPAVSDEDESDTDTTLPAPAPDEEPEQPIAVPPAAPSQAERRVFITHGKDKTFIDPIKKLLGFGELVPVVSIEQQSVSKPVPDKVMDDMRSCGAAIIHVDAEQKLIDQGGEEHIVLNPNVLIEIGAAIALYGRRFILLVREGIELPSNLQGLYQVRYHGNSLDGDATIRLLEAINDIKNHPLPKPYKE